MKSNNKFIHLPIHWYDSSGYDSSYYLYYNIVITRGWYLNTVKSDGALGFAERVLGYALVIAEIRLAQVSDGEPHVDVVSFLRVRRHILLVLEQHSF